MERSTIIPELKKTYLIDKEVEEIRNPEIIKDVFNKFPNASVFLVFRNNNDFRNNLCLGIETESITYCHPGADLWVFFPFLKETIINPNFVPFFFVKNVANDMALNIKRKLKLVHFNGAARQSFETPEIYVYPS